MFLTRATTYVEKYGGILLCHHLTKVFVFIMIPMLILEGCAQTAAVGDPMEVIGLLFFLCS